MTPIFIKILSETVFVIPMTNELINDKRFIGIATKVGRKYITVQCTGPVSDLTQSVFLKDTVRQYRDMWE